MHRGLMILIDTACLLAVPLIGAMFLNSGSKVEIKNRRKPMRAYPTAATQPNRKIRKSQRGPIFAENKAAVKEARKARRAARDSK